jgi:putative flavoprotein involved in K+ transport
VNGASGAHPLDVLVIGGGQAGLAMGYHLAERRLRYQIVDAGDQVGQAWASRWDSLRLFTSRPYDNLPGLRFPSGPEPYPGKEEVAAYLRSYADRFRLPVRLQTRVTSVTRRGGLFVAETGDDPLEARNVVVATGAFQAPVTPPMSTQLDPDVFQTHSLGYRRPEAIPPGRVLVVGAGNTGCQVALELSATRSVELAVGARIPTVPQRPLGRDIWTWAAAARLDRITADSRIGRRLAGRDQIIGTGPRRLARRHGVGLRPRITGASGRQIRFSDGSAGSYDAVVWATGFRTDHTWIDVDGVHDRNGALRQSRGVTPSRGLYTVGQPWQHTRGSALLGWVGDDAAFVADHLLSAAA